MVKTRVINYVGQVLEVVVVDVYQLMRDTVNIGKFYR